MYINPLKADNDDINSLNYLATALHIDIWF